MASASKERHCRMSTRPARLSPLTRHSPPPVRRRATGSPVRAVGRQQIAPGTGAQSEIAIWRRCPKNWRGRIKGGDNGETDCGLEMLPLCLIGTDMVDCVVHIDKVSSGDARIKAVEPPVRAG
jgi:hypothetical protein